MTVVSEPPEHVIAVVSLDSPYGYMSGIDTTYYAYKTRSLAELFAGKHVKRMQDEGPMTAIRGVFIKDGQDWKTVGSYFDV